MRKSWGAEAQSGHKSPLSLAEAGQIAKSVPNSRRDTEGEQLKYYQHEIFVCLVAQTGDDQAREEEHQKNENDQHCRLKSQLLYVVFELIHGPFSKPPRGLLKHRISDRIHRWEALSRSKNLPEPARSTLRRNRQESGRNIRRRSRVGFSRGQRRGRAGYIPSARLRKV